MPLLVPVEHNANTRECDDLPQTDPPSQADQTTSPALLKISAEEQERLLNLHNNYDEITSKFNITVRPWFGSDYAKKPRISLFTQYTLYKCMHDECVFATDDPDRFEEHMKKHWDFIDVIQHRIGINKHIRTKHNHFKECPYCNSEFPTNPEFLNHMNIYHRFSPFQCVKCFYRTHEMDNIVLHYEEFHPKIHKDVLLCHEQREVDEKDFEQIEEYCVENIKKFVCGQGKIFELSKLNNSHIFSKFLSSLFRFSDGCQDEFACWNSLYAHIKKQHNGVYKCPYCVDSVNMSESNDIKNHMAVCPAHEAHEIQEFQCIYCNNSDKIQFNEIGEIKKHMAIMHSSNFLFIGTRYSVDPDNDSGGDIQIVYAGDMYNHQNYNLYKCTNPEKLSLPNPYVLDAQQQYEEQKNLTPIMEKFKNSIPITFRKKFSFVTFDDYKEYLQSQESKITPLVTPSVNTPVTPSVTTPVTPSVSQPATTINFAKLQDIIQTVQSNTVQPKTEFKSKPNLTQVLRPVVAQQNTPTVTSSSATQKIYKCINMKAEDLENKLKSSYLSGLCHDCSKFVEANNVQDYLEHLMSHNAKDICTETTNDPLSIVKHRSKNHKRAQITYLQAEKNESMAVYKLVTCTFECPYCARSTETYTTVLDIHKHHANTHRDNYMDSKILQKIKVIASNDPQQSINTETTESHHFSLSHLFCCKYESCLNLQPLGSKSEAIRHHTQHHNNERLALAVKQFIIPQIDLHNEDNLQMYVYQCNFHCSNYFASKESMLAHIENAGSNTGFTIQKLYNCTQCSVVTTYDDLLAHRLSKHPDMMFVAGNVINPKLCGFCNDRPSNSFSDHVKKMHSRCNLWNLKVMRKLNVDKKEIGDCLFEPECCPTVQFHDIISMLYHVASCSSSKRLWCNQCPGQRFSRLTALVEHRIKQHGDTKETLTDLLHNLKTFELLFDNMQIVFRSENGLKVSLDRIKDLNLGSKILCEIRTKSMNVFEREVGYFNFV